MTTLLQSVSLVLTAAALIAGGGTQAVKAASSGGGDQPLLVFAAASLKNAMDGVSKAYDASHHGPKIRISYAGSSTLARQIEAGAPADVYISANEQWMNKLADDGLINKSSRTNLLGNSLVLVAPKSSNIRVALRKGVELAGMLGDDQYLALANTDAVPAGIYAKHALQWLGAWSRLRGHIAPGEDVRAALALVSRGESPLGVVYASDAVADRGVRVVDVFPAASHKPILYPVAATADSHNPGNARFLAFLKSARAARIFKRWGFTIVAADH